MNAPTMSNPSPDIAVELRVLHGPQAGSRLTLMPQETHLLGSGDACTVMLAGAQVQAEHARLTIHADHWLVEPDQGGVATLDGQTCGPDRPLAFGTVVQLGLVKLTIDQEDAAWPQDEALQPSPKPVPPTEATGSEATKGTRTTTTTESAGHNDDAPTPAAGDRPRAPQREACAAPPRAARARRLLATGLLACMAGSAIALTAYAGWQMSAPSAEALPADDSAIPFADEDASGSTPPPPSDQEVLDTWLEPLQRLGRLALERERDGPWRVVGHVASLDDREQLTRAARSLPWPVDIAVLTDTERQARMRRALEALASPTLQTRIIGTQGAVLQIRVLAAQAADATRLVAQVRQTQAHMEPFAFEVLRPSDIRTRFLDGLQANELAAHFDVLRNEPELRLSGRLPQQALTSWERYFSAFTAEYGSVLTIHATVRTERDSVESRIRAVVAGPYPYVITTAGERVAPGGRIDGRVLTAIGAQEVVFNDGLRVRLHP